MRVTGIVERIDDYGRLLVPKEIRRKLRIREADRFEIFIGDDDTIIFKKYDVDALPNEGQSPLSGYYQPRFEVDEESGKIIYKK